MYLAALHQIAKDLILQVRKACLAYSNFKQQKQPVRYRMGQEAFALPKSFEALWETLKGYLLALKHDQLHLTQLYLSANILW